MSKPILDIIDLNVWRNDAKIIKDLSLSIKAGEIVVLSGRNGAGKTTLLRAIMGLERKKTGSITFQDHAILNKAAWDIAPLGIGYVPQGRRLFSELTVQENLEIGCLARKTSKQVYQQALSLFPRLEQRLNQIAGTLSGGEQQMLAIARALCLDPHLIMLDEPTEGLMPSMIEAIRIILPKLAQNGRAVLLVEQRVEAVIDIGNYFAFMENGSLQQTVDASQLHEDPSIITRYNGVL